MCCEIGNFSWILGSQEVLSGGEGWLICNQSHAELSRLAAKVLEFGFSIFGFVMFHPLVDILGPVFEHSVNEHCEFSGHGGDGFGHADLSDEATKICAQGAMTVSQRARGQS